MRQVKTAGSNGLDPARGLDAMMAGLAAAVWLAYALIVIARALAAGGAPWAEGTPARLGATISGLALTLCVWAVLRRWGRGDAIERFKRAALLSSVACLAHTLLNEGVYVVTTTLREQPVSTMSLAGFLTAYFGYLWIFITWSALCAVIVASTEAREQDKAVADARYAAQQAQLASLRYQVQPHFLFNALNAISSLIGSNRSAEAEVALLRLASFYRHTLASAPNEFVRLGAEIRAQQQYLGIEEVRFPDRLTARFSVAPEVETAMVPSLVLQPFVENAVKHGLARSLDMTTIEVAAERIGDRLSIRVSDDARPTGPVASAGLGRSLENIRRRLDMLYDGDFTLEHGPEPGGGWLVTLDLPHEVEAAT